MKVFYALNDAGEVTLDRIVETRVIYEDVEDNAQTGENFVEETPVTEEPVEEISSEQGDTELTSEAEVVVEEPTAETEVSAEETTEATDESTITYVVNGDEESTTGTIAISEENLENYVAINPEIVVENPVNEDAQVATNEKVSAVSEDEIQQEAPSTASFAESERAELETLKREKKVTLVESYNESLSEEDKAGLMEELDALTYEELELKLLKLYKAHQEAEDESDFVAAPVPFAVPEPQKPETAENKLNSYIRRMLKK